MQRFDEDVFQTSENKAISLAAGTDMKGVAALSSEEMTRRVRLAFKRMPEEQTLIVSAKVMTSAETPHDMKVAVWDAVRYSHVWWLVDEVLKGAVMENPIVQCAFADALPMRKWLVEKRIPGYLGLCVTVGAEILIETDVRGMTGEIVYARFELLRFMYRMIHSSDAAATEELKKFAKSVSHAADIAQYRDRRGNNLLWYLTYRDDQNAEGGFACPNLERELLRLGVDPNERNDIDLCWNDVAHHVNRRTDP